MSVIHGNERDVTLLASIPDTLQSLDDAKPFVEIIAGRNELKLLGGRSHHRILRRLADRLGMWAASRGEVAVERRCFFVGAGVPHASLVPDVGYFSQERLPSEIDDDARTRPRIAPDIVLEIVSPLDRAFTLEEKIDLYLRNGAALVILVHARRRAFEFRRSGCVPLRVAVSGNVACPGFDDLFMNGSDVFAGM